VSQEPHPHAPNHIIADVQLIEVDIISVFSRRVASPRTHAECFWLLHQPAWRGLFPKDIAELCFRDRSPLVPAREDLAQNSFAVTTTVLTRKVKKVTPNSSARLDCSPRLSSTRPIPSVGQFPPSFRHRPLQQPKPSALDLHAACWVPDCPYQQEVIPLPSQ